MVTVRFSNETDSPLDFMIEPWGTVRVIEPGSRFAVHYPSPEQGEDKSYTEYHAGMLRFQCDGATFEVDVDGVRIYT